jgi:hypothetical protein
MPAKSGGLLMIAPSPPGDTIRDIIDEKGISQEKLGHILDASSAGNLLKGMENVEKVGTGWRKVAEAET